jgi:TFIIF-interacting CTD phosphatase-like protein
LYDFLDSVSEHYSLFLFTASQREYGEKVAKLIDPQEKYFSKKFYRENCIKTRGKVTFGINLELDQRSEDI